jgi:allantoicase
VSGEQAVGETAGEPGTEPGAGFGTAFAALPDLASRALGGAVVWANDEFFAEKENLIKPQPPVFDPDAFTDRGHRYDGWETRRRRPGTPGVAGTDHDSAIIRLGAPGVIRGVIVDTAHFLGNYPPRCSVEATWLPGYPSPKKLLRRAQWTTLVPPSPLRGGVAHVFPVDGPERRYSHVRLNMLPDGGIARIRVHGSPVADPDYFEDLTADLAALRDGARVVRCSDMFFGRADNMLMPGVARGMGEGWENARRRDAGNDWAEIALVGEGVVRVLEIDTTHFKGNAPHKARVSAAWIADPGPDADSDSEEPLSPDAWSVLLPTTKLQPDTPHRFLVPGAQPATHLRLDVYPDGGVSRLRAWGTLTPGGHEALARRWKQTG